ncbi:DUF6716 putative glycosyltransferase [Streptomyces smaragdinus]|uniref:DUF6716 putative glycosyltransferase n=1 Tax=Streptomyces smaragdinus TaxID=2585196 RepID=UPI002B1F1536|nr:DUF6716 putative glycosyltransferase [Streptomyces smaragdinus]
MLDNSPTPLRTAVIADSDTRWKWGVLAARRMAPAASADGFLLRGRATPTPRQLAETGVGVEVAGEVTGPEFTERAREYDVVVLACVGRGVQALLHGLARLERRPVVVTGYVGVVYEKLPDGLLLRHGADVVLANSRHDAERFREVYAGIGADAASVVEAGLPFLGGKPYEPDATRPYTVVFAVQPSVPDSRPERAYLLRRAVGHARAHPEREVLVKLRSRPGEHTTHVEEAPYQRLAEKLPGGLPANCRLVYGHMGELLDRTDLLVTVSSTAALESLHRSIPTAVLTDLGIREPLGNHYFLGSGCYASWDQLDAGELPEPDPAWVARHGAADPAYTAVRARIAALTATERPPLTPWLTPRTAPGFLPPLLARYGFAPDGSALRADAVKESAARRAARTVVRRAARGAYRSGVQRVAPLIRRMGAL